MSLSSRLNKFNYHQLQNIIIELAEKYPPTDDVIDEHEKYRVLSKRHINSGIKISLNEETFYIRLSRRDYEEICSKFSDITTRRSKIIVNSERVDFLDEISEEEFAIPSDLKYEIERAISEYFMKDM